MQSDEQRQLLGAFVRARREGLPPEEPGRRRRTPGLRREELAARAGIGVTWVAWIEQGREVRPSADTLARLCGALRLTGAERAYLFTLAGRADPDNPFAPGDGDAPPSIAALVRSVEHPAYGLDPAWNICAANAGAQRLFVGMFEGDGHRNLLRYAFTDPAARALLPDWESRVERLLAEFRRDYGQNLTDPRARSVIDWLAVESPLFRQAWDRQAVSGREGGSRQFDHPDDGLLSFEQHTLCAAERPDFKVVILEPSPPR
ncbi:MAG TPA: helix-turn-helix transcriptional regulator [Sphingobium sp.]